MRLLIAWGVLVAGVLTPATLARADEDFDATPLMPVRVELHGTLDWESQLGFGFRVEYAVTDQGVVRDANDALVLSGGVDVLLEDPSSDNDPRAFWTNVHIQWNLGITERVVFWPELGLTARYNRGWDGFVPGIGLGGRYHLWRSVAVMGRLGWPIGLELGLSF